MRVAFIADQISSFIKDHDSTWSLMQAAYRAGDEVYYALASTLSVKENQAQANLIKLDSSFFESQAQNQSRTLSQPQGIFQKLNLDDFNMVFMRKDPPVDINYLNECQILALCKKALVVNNPVALINYNEKLSILNFPDLITETIVTSSKEEALVFLKQHKKIVSKPLDGKGGEGILLIEDESLLETALTAGNRIMLQKYIPEILKTGDKRIILVNGKPVGALLRIPKAGDFRANLAVGGSYAETQLSDRDLEICARLESFLIDQGIYFAGIDVIGDYLTEINITSPTCIQEINRLNPNAKPLEDLIYSSFKSSV